MTSQNNQQFAEGMTVYDVENSKVGTIYENDADQGYIVVQKGFLFPKDIYIPVNAIQNANQDGIYLSLHKNDLNGEQYGQAPQTGGTYVGGAAAGQTMQTTEQTVQTTRQPVQTTQQVSQQTTDKDIRVPVYEEDLVVGKRQEEEGRVHLHKDVVQEQETVSVPLQQEHVYVDRVAVTDQSAVNATDAFQGKDIEVPVMGEEAVVGKQVREVEEVRLHKDVVTENQQVSDTVRKERVTIDGVDDQNQGRNRR